MKTMNVNLMDGQEYKVGYFGRSVRFWGKDGYLSTAPILELSKVRFYGLIATVRIPYAYGDRLVYLSEVSGDYICYIPKGATLWDENTNWYDLADFEKAIFEHEHGSILANMVSKRIAEHLSKRGCTAEPDFIDNFLYEVVISEECNDLEDIAAVLLEKYYNS